MCEHDAVREGYDMKHCWWLFAVLVFVSACTPQEEVVANVPTATFLPIPSALPRFTATPELSLIHI